MRVSWSSRRAAWLLSVASTPAAGRLDAAALRFMMQSAHVLPCLRVVGWMNASDPFVDPQLLQSCAIAGSPGSWLILALRGRKVPNGSASFNTQKF